MNIVNDRPVMVFKKEKRYSVGLSKKNQNGEYEKAYYPIQFNKDIELEDKTLIKINNAWLSWYDWEYEDKKGRTFFIKCTDFEEVEKEDSNPFEEFGKEHNSGNEITDSDLPF